ncbi:MAG: hypothetical protein AAF724_20505 [Pseudomonadota bacterium]
MILPILPMGWLVANKWTQTAKSFVIVSACASMYCLIVGVSLAFGWQDPSSDATSEQLVNGATSQRGTLTIIIISLWPYLLTGVAGYIAYYILPDALKSAFRDR